jgi:hypothetical protein
MQILHSLALESELDDPEDEGMIALLHIEDTVGKPSEVGPSDVSMDLGKACRIETYAESLPWSWQQYRTRFDLPPFP